MVRVSKLTQTCTKSPTQWEGRTSDGRQVYVRYRWGWLTIGIGQTLDEAVINEKNLFERQLGEKQDGDLDYAKLRAVTDGLVEWPESFERR
jgi:hypothetical protein